MNKKDLMDKIGLSPATVAKMTKGKFVRMEVLYRIVNGLDVDFKDIIAVHKEKESEKIG